MSESVTPSHTAPEPERDSLVWRTARIAAVVLAMVAAAAVLAYAAGGFLLLFAGLLFAVLLDALTRAAGYLLPIRRAFRLALVCGVLAALVAGFVSVVGVVAVQQAPEVMETVDEQMRELGRLLDDLDLEGNEDEEEGIPGWLPDPGSVISHAGAAFATVFGAVGNFAVIVVLGLFLAAQPSLYRDGAVLLVRKESRPRFAEVLDEIGMTLRYWLIGQSITMVLIGTIVWAALTVVGMPGALLLGVFAGLMNFVPTIGPILAAIPIFLVAMGQEWWLLIYALAVYTFIQMLEGYVLTPLIQRRAVHLPPALIFTAQILLAVLFGFIGLVLATPIAAAAKVAVIRLYVEDVLEDPMGQN